MNPLAVWNRRVVTFQVMERTAVGGATLAYEEQGAGETVVLAHGGLFADTFLPMMSEPALADYRMIRYHRRGHGESTVEDSQMDFGRQSADAIALLDRLGIDKAHFVGHSASGPICLRIAVSYPDRVRSLVLIEPGVPEALGQEAMVNHLMPLFTLVQAGELDAALDALFELVLGKGFRDVFERTIPGAVQQGLKDLELSFTSEAPHLLGFQFGREEAARVTHPVLLILGSESDAVVRRIVPVDVFRPGCEQLMTVLPDAALVELPGLDHQMPWTGPTAVAEAIAAFLNP